MLDRLVELHDARIAEVRAGQVRWVRPAYQLPRFGSGQTATLGIELAVPERDRSVPEAALWPADAIGQITVLRQLAAAAPISVDDAMRRFTGAPRAIVGRHLESLAILGEVRPVAGGRYTAALAAA